MGTVEDIEGKHAVAATVLVVWAVDVVAMAVHE